MPRRILMSLVVVVTAGSGLLTTTTAHAAGETKWIGRYDGPLSRDDVGTAMAVSPDGTRVFETGYSTGSDLSLEYATVAFDANTGTEEWASRYNPTEGTDQAFAVAVSPDGTTVFVTGRSEPGAGGFDYATIAYAADTGATRWVRRYSGTEFGEDIAAAIGVSPDGGTVFVTGTSQAAGSSTDYATVAYDASTGANEWIKRYNGPGDEYDQANALAVSSDGSTVFVTGVSKGSSTYDYATVAYAADTGATRWVRRNDAPGDAGSQANAVTVSPDGGAVFVTGTSRFNYLTIAYEAGTGSTMWARRYRPTCPCNDQANALAVSPDGSTVFVTGGSISSGGLLDYATVAYAGATGTKLWARRHHRPKDGNDVARSVAVSPDGATVYVTGTQASLRGATTWYSVAYDAATGARRWNRRNHPPGSVDNRPNTVAVSPDGSTVFVAGSSSGSTGYSDFVTVAYAA